MELFSSPEMQDKEFLGDHAGHLIELASGVTLRRLPDIIKTYIDDPSQVIRRTENHLIIANAVSLHRQRTGEVVVMAPGGDPYTIDMSAVFVPPNTLALQKNDLDKWLEEKLLRHLRVIGSWHVQQLLGSPDWDCHFVPYYWLHRRHLAWLSVNETAPDGDDPALSDRADELLARGADEILSFLDPDGVTLARKCASRQATLETYNRMMRDKSIASRISLEARHFMPLVDLALDEKVVDAVSLDVLKQTKLAFIAAGGSNAGWKFLSRLAIDDMRWLGANFEFRELAVLARIFGEIQILPNKAMIRKLLQGMNDRYDPFLPPVWFIRAVAQGTRAMPHNEARRFFSRWQQSGYTELLDWLRGSEIRPDANQTRGGLAWITKASRIWHEQVTHMRVARQLVWHSALSAYQDGLWRVVPLTSSEDLEVEATRMHHCVNTYDDYAVRGRSRLFSIRDAAGHSKVTVELQRHGEAWTVFQAKGPCNAEPGVAYKPILDRLAKKYNAAYGEFMRHNPGA